MKKFIIGGIATVVIITGAAILLDGKNSSIDPQENLLRDYQEFSEDLKSSKMESRLTNSCNDSQTFENTIKNLEQQLEELQERKNTLIEEKKAWEALAPKKEREDSVDISPEDMLASDEDIDVSPEDMLADEEVSPEDMLADEEVSPEDMLATETSQEDILAPEENQDDTLEAINELEKEIYTTIENLKVLCNLQEEKPESISNTCTDACKKYSECASYAEDFTPEDWVYAYESCMIECSNRSDETKICINKKPIKKAQDCANLSICALKEYGNLMGK